MSVVLHLLYYEDTRSRELPKINSVNCLNNKVRSVILVVQTVHYFLRAKRWREKSWPWTSARISCPKLSLLGLFLKLPFLIVCVFQTLLFHIARRALGAKGATRLGATRPAALRGEWHSERVSERVPGVLFWRLSQRSPQRPQTFQNLSTCCLHFCCPLKSAIGESEVPLSPEEQFRKRAENCFKSTVPDKRTHWASLNFRANSVSSAKNSVSSLWHTYNRTRGTHWVLSSELGEDQENSLSSVSETVLSETVFGPFPSNTDITKTLFWQARHV